MDSTHLLHGLWLPGKGLGLWLERVEGHLILESAAQAGGALPEPLAGLLGSRPLRRGPVTVLASPSGRRVRKTPPMRLLAPPAAAAALAVAGDFDGHPAIDQDLRYLARVAAGIRAHVRAGRVMPAVTWEADSWYLKFRLADGIAEAPWLAELRRLLPEVLRANGGPALLDDLLAQLAHEITLRELSGYAAAAGRHRMIRTMLDGTPLRNPPPGFVAGLNEWRASVNAARMNLVLTLEEPEPEEDPEGAPAEAAVLPLRADRYSGAEADPGRDGTGGAAPVTALDGARGAAAARDPLSGTEPAWPLRVGVLDEHGAELPADPELLGAGVRRSLDRLLAAAATAFPPLGAAAPAGRGLDLLLTGREVEQLLLTGIGALAEAGIRVRLPAGWDRREPAARITLRAAEPTGSVRGATPGRVGLDQLVDYSWRISVDGREIDEAAMALLLESKTGLIRLRDRFIMVDPVKARRMLEHLRNRAGRADRFGGTAPMVELIGLDDEVRQATDAEVDLTVAGELGDFFNGVVDPRPEELPAPPGLRAELRPHQLAGMAWLEWMSRHGFGAVLADDMGLGKTIQVLALLLHERAHGGAGPALVVAPTSVAGNWVDEAARFAPDLRTVLHHGPRRARGAEFTAAAAGADIVITTYPLLARDEADLATVDWAHIVLDEAQAIKNPNTAVSRVARRLPGRHAIALTGTPMENNLGELHTIMDFCAPGLLGSARSFRAKWARPIETGADPGAAARLRRMLDPFILRRVKTDPAVIGDLPEKQENTEFVELTVEQAALYAAYVRELDAALAARRGDAAEAGRSAMSRRALVLTSLTRLKQICNHPAHYLADGSPITDGGGHRSGKVRRLVELLDLAVGQGESTLVFTQYAEFGRLLRPYLAERYGRPIPFLHGGVPRAERLAMVEEFNAPGGPPVLLLSLKAGGTGLNLTGANHVVHVDRWWNPAVENQATDRAYRIGQLRDVTVHKLVSRGTLEERIDRVIADKIALGGAVIGTGARALTELDDAELRTLVHLDARPRPGGGDAGAAGRRR